MWLWRHDAGEGQVKIGKKGKDRELRIWKRGERGERVEVSVEYDSRKLEIGCFMDNVIFFCILLLMCIFKRFF